MEQSQKTKPKVRSGASFLLSEWREDGIKHGTKGTFVYEVLQMYLDEELDDIDEYESMVDSQLHSENIYLSESVENDVDTESVLKKYDTDDSTVRMKIWLPKSFKDNSLPARGLGSLIEDAVEHYIDSPFADRTHRISVKKEVLEAVRTDTVPDSDVAEEWMEVNGLLTEQWYHSDSLTVEQLVQRGEKISQKNREARIEALRTAVSNATDSPSEMDLVDLAEKAFDVSTGTAEDYVEESDLLVYVDATNLVQVAEKHKETVAWNMPETNLGLSSDTNPKEMYQQISIFDLANIDESLQQYTGTIEAKRAYDILHKSKTIDREIQTGLREKNLGNVEENIQGKIQEEMEMIREEVVAEGFDPEEYLDT